MIAGLPIPAGPFYVEIVGTATGSAMESVKRKVESYGVAFGDYFKHFRRKYLHFPRSTINFHLASSAVRCMFCRASVQGAERKRWFFVCFVRRSSSSSATFADFPS